MVRGVEDARLPLRLYLNDGTALVASLTATDGFPAAAQLVLRVAPGNEVAAVIDGDIATFTFTAEGPAATWAHQADLSLVYNDDTLPAERVIGFGSVLRNVGVPGLSLSSFHLGNILTATTPAATSGPVENFEGAATEDSLRNVLDVSVRAVETAVTSGNAVAAGTRTATQQTKAAVDAGNATLGLILTELGQKLEAGQAVALDAATLAALEQITVSGTVALDAPTLAALAQSGTVALDAPTLAALENITAVVSGPVALDSATLAALETVSAAVTGTVALDAPTLAALEQITVSGEIALNAATLAALESVTAAVTGTVALDAPTLAALEQITAVISGTVALDAPTMAVLAQNTADVEAAVDATTTAVVAVDGRVVDLHNLLSLVLTELDQKLEPGQSIALDPPTLAALEQVTATLSGPVALDAPTLAALESITAAVTGTVALDAATLAALEQITATVANFPETFPLPAEQAAALAPQTDALTDDQLRAAPVVVHLDAEYDAANPLETAARLVDENGVRYSALNRLPVDVDGAAITGTFTVQPSTVSTLNVPDHALAADELFVGVWEDVGQFAAIQIALVTDAPSTTGGAAVEFSADGINVIHTIPTTVPANVGSYFHLAPEARYVRFRYQNGPTAQTYNHVQIGYSYNAPVAPAGPIGAQSNDMSVASATKAHLAARIMDGPAAGAYVPVGNDGTGRMLVRTEQEQPLTDTELRATALPVSGTVQAVDSGEREYTHVTATVTAAGDTVVAGPAGSGPGGSDPPHVLTPGKAARLRWIYAINDPTASTPTLIKVSLGSTELYRVWALSKRQLVTGAVNAPLVINLSAPGNVAVTVLLEEV